MNKPIYNITKNGRKLTKEGQTLWNGMLYTLHTIIDCPLFDEHDTGEITDGLVRMFPRLNKMDIYHAVVELRSKHTSRMVAYLNN